ncbi:MAG TPA: DUF559 domain-containing protein, partial [Candidatus Dormibacteraeota bacterium]
MVVSSVSRARRLRRSMTGVELILWSRLRRQQLEGHRFRRQAPIGPYEALPRESRNAVHLSRAKDDFKGLSVGRFGPSPTGSV